jgi:hypothetical protein
VQNAQEGFLACVFDKLRRTKAAAEFNQQEGAEIRREMSFGLSIALGEPIHVVLVKHLTLRAPSVPVDSMVQRRRDGTDRWNVWKLLLKSGLHEYG